MNWRRKLIPWIMLDKTWDDCDEQSTDCHIDVMWETTCDSTKEWWPRTPAWSPECWGAGPTMRNILASCFIISLFHAVGMNHHQLATCPHNHWPIEFSKCRAHRKLQSKGNKSIKSSSLAFLSLNEFWRLDRAKYSSLLIFRSECKMLCWYWARRRAMDSLWSG